MEIISGIIGLLMFGAALMIRPFFGALLLQLSAHWVVSLPIGFGAALITELAAVGANIVTLLAFGIGITALDAAAGPTGLDETALGWLGVVYILVCVLVHAWVVNWRHRAGFVPSLLVVLTMGGIMLGVGLLLTLGIFGLLAAAGVSADV